jgi:photosystem II stability/assembly factor-like uncharacterized protein
VRGRSLSVATAAAILGAALVMGSWAKSRARRHDRASAGAEHYVWKNVAIHGGGFVTGIVFNPAERDLVYARTDIGGAYRWNAKAGDWEPLLDWVGPPDWNLHGVESLATDPTQPNRVYIAAGTYTSPEVSSGEILLSDDYGHAWRRVPMPFKMGGNEAGRGSGERLAVDPRKGSILFFGSRRDGLWRSLDYGVTWRRVESFPNLPDGSAAFQPTSQPPKFNYLAQAVGIVFVRFDPSSGRPGEPTPAIYAAISRTGESVFRSLDAGATWEAVPGQPVRLRPTRADLSANGSLFVTYADEPGPNRMGDGAVFKLDTKSGVWADITPEKPSPATGRGFGYAAVCVDPSDAATVLVTTWNRGHPFDEIFRSKDGGATWTAMLEKAAWDHSIAPYTATMRHHWMSSVAIDPFDPNHVLFTTGFGIWATRNASDSDRGGPTRWSFDDRGLEETVPLALVSPPEGPHLISGLGDIDGFRHDDLDSSPHPGRFDAPGYKNTEWLDLAGRAPDVLVRSGTTYGNDRILGAFSRDGGIHWSGFPAEPPRPEPKDRFGTGPIAVSADGRVIVWTIRRAVPHLTRDDGKTWQAVSGAPVDLRLVADRVDASRFYGYDAADGVLYVSSDGGSTVQPAVRGLPTPRARGWATHADVRAVPGRAGELWMAVDRSLFHFNPAPSVMARIASVEEATSVGFGKAADDESYPAIFVVGKIGGTFGIFRSDDQASKWIRINDDAHGYGSASHVTGDSRIFGRVYFATGGRGIIYGDIAR